ncbi:MULTISPECIES: fimbria/pilus outer membrane usher protein [Pseudomonas]|uniref:Fimbria/pilus outer membrane usher protein n=1 Tax=Pseudomonas azadiae TaxID=2843612 RepID=A0ABS6NYQ7_9PSED|nr:MULTISPECIES: fimbria/pilus outer membrane usher protein [Pseudomonas]MBV4453344.1 fimbria/pilus outer membrane usher protein [Pseudomonas azadiae]NMF42914.1 fimbria/pilus outer membrane usher protein [Pseudomonas sp. SWRI 103]
MGLATLWGLPGSSAAVGLGEGFDLAALTSLGIDPQVSEYFRSAARFREGVHVVGLRVNGTPLGLVDARFDYQGQLCFTPALLAKAGLVTPSRVLREGINPDQTCHDFVGQYPATLVRLRPSSDEVTLVVPTQSLRTPEWEAGSFSQGGAAAIFNYTVLGQDTHSRSGPSRFVSAYTEAGFNLGNWIVRSRQFYISDNGRARTEQVDAYAQRDIAALQSTFQAGLISSNNPIFGGVQLAGLQFSPDGQQRGGAGNSEVVVEGLAQSQSRVEVRQSGALIHSTLVPEGPFRLSGLPLLNSTSDLDVSVIDVRGAKRSFVVPAASFRGGAPVTPGYYFSLGKVRQTSIDSREGDSPVVVMGSGTWGLGQRSSLGFGLLSTDEYRSAGGTLSSVFFHQVTVGARHNLSREELDGVGGSRSTLSLGSPLFANLEMNLSASTQSRGYREVLDAGQASRGYDLDARFKRQYTAGMTWTDPFMGGFSLSFTRSSQFDGRSTDHLFASWNKSFNGVDVALIADAQVGGARPRRPDRMAGGRRDEKLDEDTSLRLQVTLPLGGDRRVSTYVSRRGDRLAAGTALSERVNDYVDYEVGVDRDVNEREQRVRGRLDLLPLYTRVSLGVTRDPSSTHYSGQLQGGIVAHEHGVTFSPYAVQDTFGIVSVGDIGAAKISTPQGPVWTDFSGQAVIPGLQAYGNNHVQVQTQSLPRRVDLKNGTKVLAAGRGSVNILDFDVVKVRRLLLEAQDEQGRPLPQGAAVFGDSNNFVTSVVGDGMIFLSNIDGPQTLRVSLPDSASCLLHINPEQEPDDDQLYETAPVVCRAR